MKDIEKAGRELMSGDKAGLIKNAVNSEEGRRIGKAVDGEALKKAVMSGDRDAVSQILGQVLATDDGKALAERLNRQLGGK